jgi:hypothetical protein
VHPASGSRGASRNKNRFLVSTSEEALLDKKEWLSIRRTDSQA